MHSLLRRYGLDPHKGLGQNFLVDHAALRRIIASAEIAPGDAVLEIGAGLGSLTRLLAVSARQVCAVEIDRHLIAPLKEVVSGFSNVKVVEGDMLDLDPAVLMQDPGYLVVANIPYYITSALIRHLLDSGCRPSRMVLTMQREVADRICAEAGELSLLALSVQVYGKPHIAAVISAGSFYPAPKVDSATLRVDLYAEPLIPEAHLADFFRLAKHGFSQKRKTMRNTLAAGLHIDGKTAAALLESAGIDPTRRAQTLDLVEWRTLVSEYLAQKEHLVP